jgi:hypothetical protein
VTLIVIPGSFRHLIFLIVSTSPDKAQHGEISVYITKILNPHMVRCTECDVKQNVRCSITEYQYCFGILLNYICTLIEKHVE